MTPSRIMARIGLPLLAGAFVALVIAERVRPLRGGDGRGARGRDGAGGRRLARNAALAASSGVVTALVVYPALFAVARTSSARGIGLLGLLPESTPAIARVGIAVLALDYSMYLWHRANHAAPLLWRFHRVHHADGALDASTAFRFHAGEVLMSVAYRAPVVALLGVSAELLAAFEIALELATQFQHADVKLPERLERALDAVLVTPSMHGTHHSDVASETDSNWSVIFSFWDRLHGTYRRRPREAPIAIGLPGHREAAARGLGALFTMPFRGAP